MITHPKALDLFFLMRCDSVAYKELLDWFDHIEYATSEAALIVFLEFLDNNNLKIEATNARSTSTDARVHPSTVLPG